MTHPFEKHQLRQISGYDVSTVRDSEKNSLITNRKSTVGLSTSYRWSAYVTFKCRRGGSKSDFSFLGSLRELQLLHRLPTLFWISSRWHSEHWHILSRPWSRQPNDVMSEIECAKLHGELFRRRHSTRQSHGLFALAKHLLISDIRALWHSALSVRVPECQKLKI